ncbi:MAG TPA: YceI family protein [Actinomycetota bacterium]|nr:YceI family protein [Actinomycetota bacterium]
MSQTEESLRSVDGMELPAAGTWEIDPVHSHVSFVVRHLMVSKVRGRFGTFSGTIEVAEAPKDSTVQATIDAASIDTGEPNRDAHVRSADFLEVEKFPTITFSASGVAQQQGTEFTLTGDLTIKGITKPVTLEAEYLGVIVHPQMGTRMGLSATGEINKDDFGVTFNAALETGGFMLGKTIRLEVEVEAIRKS